jgi:hypothetical protein
MNALLNCATLFKILCFSEEWMEKNSWKPDRAIIFFIDRLQNKIVTHQAQARLEKCF